MSGTAPGAADTKAMLPPPQSGMGPPPLPGLLGAMPMGAASPPPLPQMRGLYGPDAMRPTGQPLESEQMLGTLILQREEQPDDSDAGIPPGLKPYVAGLRPTPKPANVPWQQEIVYQKLGKTDQEIEAIAQYFFRIAQNYDTYLSRERVTANQYYNGKPFNDGSEATGRSQLVLTTVRDTIRSTLPSLLRVFTAVEDPVSFEPCSSEILADDKLATTLARQATDYCRWALFTANKGWQILHDTLLDALTRKAGWVRWYWGAKKEVRIEVCEGLLQPQLQLLLAEPGIEAQRIVRRPMTPAELQALQKTPDGQMYLSQGGPPEYWSATITRSAQRAWPVVQAVPSECVWVVADSATVEDARAVFQVRDVPASQLIENGLPADKVLAYLDTLQRPQQRREAISRDQASGYNIKPGPPNDRSMANVRYAEGWIRCDADNDHKEELLHVHLLGNASALVQWERTDEIPLACFTPYREPGRVIGFSQADMVMDLQRVESRVMRAILDSLGQSMFPRTVAVLGQVNMADVRQTAIGSIIRASQPGAVTELVKPFAGKEALPIMEVLESIRESRTGITRASQGLTVDELQSTAPIAVSQQTSAAQDRLDMVARTLAETGLAPLYLGLLRMMARQQDRPNVVRIRGQWVAVDPRALATMWEATINVGGKGMPHERLAMLAQIAQKQEQIMMQSGMDNPLVGIPEYRNTLARMLETASIADVSSYFKPLPPGWTPPPQPQQQDPNQLLAMVQQQKTAADLETDRGKAQTDRAKLLMDDDRARDQAALDAWIKAWTAGAQFGSPVPAFSEIRASMQSKAPNIGLLQDLPTPTSPAQPATGVQSLQKPPGQPQGPQPMQRPQGQPPPMTGPATPPGAMPQGSMDPATQMAVRQALAGRGPAVPTAYGQLATRAALNPIFGPGGPALPRPQGMGLGGGPAPNAG